MGLMRMTMAGVALALLGAAACSVQAPATAGDGVPKTARHATLQPFADEAALRRQWRTWREQAAREERLARRAEESANFMVMPAPAAAPAADAAAADAPEVAAADAAASPEGESITNVQTAGVDEGGIVKRAGDHLVVLRRGRLFTLRIGGDDLRPVSAVDAFGPGIDPRGTWYDEMLVAGDTIAVIGYSYQRGGTELGLFDLARDGTITYRATWHLRSNDYYSSRNYASRLIGHTLVFYSPLFIDPGHEDIEAAMPGVRKWQPGMARDAAFTRILPAERVYRPARPLGYSGGLALHTVTTCDLSTPELQCRATAVLGRPGNTFYVSGDAAYVWTHGWGEDEAPARTADVFRIPLDGSAPGALEAEGAPIDQMSFLERDGHLNVLVSAQGQGQWMWGAEHSAGEVALLRVPLAMFADGRDVATARHYRRMPSVGRGGALQNRYVGDWLLFGIGETWGDAAPGVLHAVRYAGDGGEGDLRRVQVGHAVARIEALGNDALVVGNAGRDLRYTSVRLGDAPAVASVFVQPDAMQGESRTHGFFYRPVDAGSGFIGLPILGRDARGEASAAVQFLHQRALALAPAGALVANGVQRQDDGCQASCVDWYGDARPIFIGTRVFALMGYELVEGRYDGTTVRERRRVDFTPATRAPVAQ